MRLLLHACCAPCSVMCVASLQEDGLAPTLFWYNPNIHPFTEYESRRGTLVQYAASLGLELILRDDYGLRAFVGAVSPNIDARCAYCYRIRMEETARFAAQNGYAAFSTTLLISPYQDHDKLRAIAEEAATAHGVDFFYRDFRTLFREGQARARASGLYMQKYCGCIFSEEDRYRKKIAALEKA